MNDFREPLTACVNATTKTVPVITRCVIQASQSSKPYAERRRLLADAIRETEGLAEELKRQQKELGWRELGGYVA